MCKDKNSGGKMLTIVFIGSVITWGFIFCTFI